MDTPHSPSPPPDTVDTVPAGAGHLPLFYQFSLCLSCVLCPVSCVQYNIQYTVQCPVSSPLCWLSPGQGHNPSMGWGVGQQGHNPSVTSYSLFSVCGAGEDNTLHLTSENGACQVRLGGGPSIEHRLTQGAAEQSLALDWTRKASSLDQSGQSTQFW